MAKPKGGLTKWFKEDWRDIKTGKKCGRSGKEKGIIFGAAQVKAAIESLRHAVDRLDQAVRLLETRTQSVEQRIARLEGKTEK